MCRQQLRCSAAFWHCFAKGGGGASFGETLPSNVHFHPGGVGGEGRGVKGPMCVCGRMMRGWRERRTLTQFRVCYPEGGGEERGRPLMVLCPDAPRFQLPIFGHLGRVGWESAGAQSPGQRFTRARVGVGPCVRMFVHRCMTSRFKDICRRVPYISPINSSATFAFLISLGTVISTNTPSNREKPA